MAEIPPDYFRSNYNTQLNPVELLQFLGWVANRSKATGRDALADIEDYDLAGFWKDGGQADQSGHLSDKYKKPNHPTFSDESVYSGVEDPLLGTKLFGGKWLGDDESGWSYQPSQSMLKNTHSKDALRQYFADFEPDVMLLPELKSVGVKKKSALRR